jgi:O-antigen/teichoic acid export membrane protein
MVLWRISAMMFSSVGTIWAARCLGPANLGISGFIHTGVAQAALLAGLLPDAFLVRSYKNAATSEERRRLIQLALSTRLFLALILVLAGTVAGFAAGVPPTWRLAFFAGLPLLVLNGLNAGWLLQAQENQPAQYRTQFITSALSCGLYLLLFRPGVGPGADLLVALAAATVSFVLIWRATRSGPLAGYFRRFRWSDLRETFRESRNLYLTRILIYLYTQFEIPLVGYLVSVEELGMYRSAHGLKTTLWSFLSMIPLLLYPRFVEWHRRSPDLLYRNQWKLFRAFSAAAVVLGILAFAASPWIYPWIYGEAFRPAAIPFAMLVTSLFLILLNNLFGYGLWSQGKDGTMLRITVVTALVSVAANLVLIPRHGMHGAAAVNILSEGLILLLTIFATTTAHRRRRATQSRDLAHHED